jgi:hypothetical protein
MEVNVKWMTIIVPLHSSTLYRDDEPAELRFIFVKEKKVINVNIIDIMNRKISDVKSCISMFTIQVLNDFRN